MPTRDSTLNVRIRSDADTSGVQRAESRLGRLGGIAKKAGAVTAAGLAVGTAAAGKLATASISAASDVQQAYGALDTVYGKHASQVRRWSQDAASSLGLARDEYASLASVVGSQLQNMGQSQEESAKTTRRLIQIGGDLAATYGGDVSQAVEAVGSLLRGERDPIEKYGVSIKQADINARLAAQGMDDLTGEAKRQAESQATLALLTEQTKNAQGALKRESGTLAVSQQKLSAKWDNLTADLGKRFLPVATRVTTWLTDRALPGARRLGSTLRDRLGPAWNRVAGFITNRVVPAASRIYTWFSNKIAPQMRSNLQPILDASRRAWDRVAGAIEDNEPEIRTVLDWLKRFTEFYYSDIQPVLGKFSGKLITGLGYGLQFVINWAATTVRFLQWVANAAQSAYNWLTSLDDVRLSINWGALPGVGSRPDDPPPPGGGFGAAASNWRGLPAGGPAAPPRAGTVIHQTNIRVDGALDPNAVARQIKTIIARRDRRIGAVTA